MTAEQRKNRKIQGANYARRTRAGSNYRSTPTFRAVKKIAAAKAAYLSRRIQRLMVHRVPFLRSRHMERLVLASEPRVYGASKRGAFPWNRWTGRWFAPTA